MNDKENDNDDDYEEKRWWDDSDANTAHLTANENMSPNLFLSVDVYEINDERLVLQVDGIMTSQIYCV